MRRGGENRERRGSEGKEAFITTIVCDESSYTAYCSLLLLLLLGDNDDIPCFPPPLMDCIAGFQIFWLPERSGGDCGS